jgi:hypothetical protein
MQPDAGIEEVGKGRSLALRPRHPSAWRRGTGEANPAVGKEIRDGAQPRGHRLGSAGWDCGTEAR